MSGWTMTVDREWARSGEFSTQGRATRCGVCTLEVGSAQAKASHLASEHDAIVVRRQYRGLPMFQWQRIGVDYL